MPSLDIQEYARFIRDDLRLKTLPIGVKILDETRSFPDKTRRPSALLKKRVTICQAVTMARVYGWTVGLTREDLICVPAMLAFGFTDAPDPDQSLSRLFCEVDFAGKPQNADAEIRSMNRLDNNPGRSLLLAPLVKNLFEPDAALFYGNPAQIMRMVQALVYEKGQRIAGNFGGKVECTEYLIAPYRSRQARVAIPGMGDRIFSMTQDEEMVLSVPGKDLTPLQNGLKSAGKKIGARYPVTFYQNFQSEFPEPYQRIADELKLFE